MSAPATFGVDLGGTHLRVGVVDTDAAIAGQRKASTPDTLDGIVAEIAAHVTELRSVRPDARVLGVGAAGMIDHDGVIHYSPNVPAFLAAPVRERLVDALAMPVIVDNDANVAALGELEHGAARGCRDVLVVTLGTGVGGGIVCGGQLLRGAHGFAGEVGHFQIDPHGPRCACGEPGHWEALASGNALGALGRARAAAGVAPSVLELAGGDAGDVTGEHVGAAARAGAADAVAIVAEYAHQVALGLVGLVNVFDSELVVVSGGLVELGDLLLDPIRTAFAGHLEGAGHRPEVPIVPAALGDDAGMVGAAVLARTLVA
ncbi:MAG TPA: ROK family protein [Acidimicrobiia bacterium]|nr:ROK family protein [Acidimicrobiia bacterium]